MAGDSLQVFAPPPRRRPPPTAEFVNAFDACPVLATPSCERDVERACVHAGLSWASAAAPHKVLQKAALAKESQIRNIRREKSILLNITHPYIVRLHAVFQTEGRLFLLFDFLSGGSAGFESDRARFYIAEVSLAVSHLHSHSIVHRDLKAENLPEACV
eukprot:gene57285-biopygen103746